MILFVLSYVGGVLTILSPCILPVLPFVFARADQPFLKSGLPMLLGMAVTFALVATIAAVGGGWAVHANEYGRTVAIVVLAVLGLTLLFPSLADRLMRPLVAAGARLSQSAEAGTRPGAVILPSFLLGIATGLLWAPCAGPILGLILTGAALNGASVQTSLLLVAYAAGAATSLAVALLIGGRVFTAMKRSLGAGEWIRRGLGVAVLAGVLAIALGLDTGFLSRISVAGTTVFEQGLLDAFRKDDARGPAMAGPSMMMAAKPGNDAADDVARRRRAAAAHRCRRMAELAAADAGRPARQGRAGRFLDLFLHQLPARHPYVKAWAEKYKDQGLVVIGVHTPEFAFEKSVDNVKRAVRDLKIGYPVAVDSNFVIWRRFDNQYWPAHYFIDATGRIRHHHFGEGEYAESERVIQQLLAEAGSSGVSNSIVKIDAAGAEAAADEKNVRSPETYVGYERAEHFASSGGAVHDAAHAYALPPSLGLNEWGLDGSWTVENERAVLDSAGGRIGYRFHARDLHLVLGPSKDGKPVRFRILLNGQPPGADRGVDVDDKGEGVIKEQRLYQLVRQRGEIKDRTFEIQFLDPGVQAFAFTFG